MSLQRRALAALCGASLFCLAAPAGAVSIEPGQWDMTMTLQMPMLPQPQVRTDTQCITPEQSELNPDTFDDQDQGECETSGFSEEGNTVRWQVTCPGPGGTTTGDMTFTSHGDSLEGEGKMTMEIQGQTMEMNMSWTGERTGDCVE